MLKTVVIAGTLVLATLTHAQSTAFTYQGNLRNTGQPASGLHDFRFALFDAATGGTQVGTTQCVDNIFVADGLFAATVDFGAQFASATPRFLQVEVRADTGLNCDNLAGFVILGQRQAVTSAPVANHANVASTAFSLSAPDGSPANAVVVDNNGKVGIGTAVPVNSLHIAAPGSAITLQDTGSNNSQASFLEFRNGSGTLTGWFGYGTPGDPDISVVNARTNGDIVLSTLGGGRVGIGTAQPVAALDVRGDLNVVGELLFGAQTRFQAVKTGNSARLIRGSVMGGGGVGSGTGFTVTHTAGSGLYTINILTPFATSSPVAVATPLSTSRLVRVTGQSANTVSFFVSDLSGGALEGSFNLIVIGD